jgi:hypothetical protein
MKPNTYRIITDCIETGIDVGWLRAHKHTDTPSDEQIKDAIYQAVMSEIAEYFTFESAEAE